MWTRTSRKPVIYVERKDTSNIIALKKTRRMKKARLGSRITAILVVRKNVKMMIVGTKKTQAEDQWGKAKVEEPEQKLYLQT